jgi:hypothetical protein
VFWPDEECYSEVPESKIVGNPGSLGEAIQVKERQKVYSGVLVAVGSQQEVQEKLNTIEAQSCKAKELEPVTSTNNPESVTATIPATPIVAVTPAAPTTVVTTDAPTMTPAGPNDVVKGLVRCCLVQSSLFCLLASRISWQYALPRNVHPSDVRHLKIVRSDIV